MDENKGVMNTKPDEIDPQQLENSAQPSKNTIPSAEPELGRVSPTPSKIPTEHVTVDTEISKEHEKSSPSEESSLPMAVSSADQQWFDHTEIDDLHTRWTSIQVQFVDDPCSAVEQAETTVADTIERVKQKISDHEQQISRLWLNHDDITTEELRITMQNYRALLDRILKL